MQDGNHSKRADDPQAQKPVIPEVLDEEPLDETYGDPIDVDPVETAPSSDDSVVEGAIEPVPEEEPVDADVIDIQPVPNSPQFEAESFVETVAEAERVLADEQRAYSRKVAAARSELKKAQSRHDSDVKRAEKDLDKLIASYEAKVAACNDVVLYLDRITYQKHTMVLTPQISAYCESWGGIRSIPTAAAPQSAALSKGKSNVVDERELIMHIESPADSFDVSCNPDKGEEASRFVDKVIETAGGADQRQADKERRVRQARDGIEKLKRDTREIEDAEDFLEETKAQTEGVDEAERRLRHLEENASDVEAEALADSRRRAHNRKLLIWGIIIAIIIVLIIVLVSCGGH